MHETIPKYLFFTSKITLQVAQRFWYKYVWKGMETLIHNVEKLAKSSFAWKPLQLLCCAAAAYFTTLLQHLKLLCRYYNVVKCEAVFLVPAELSKYLV